MDAIASGNDPCTENVWWSALSAAAGDATLAGVLAGLLIAAAAALLARYDRSDAHTIALFGSGVPALAFSTYLFTVIAGMDFPGKNNNTEKLIGQVCSQVWSEWLLAMGLLLIGGAVLVCGLGWALVNYADTLAVKREGSESIETAQNRRISFIHLNGWLSGGVISTTIALLIPANVLYLKNVHHRGFFASDVVKGYSILGVFMLGVFFISWSTYNAIIRTRSALRAAARSCAADPGDRLAGVTGNQYGERLSQHIEEFFAISRAGQGKKVAMRAAREIAVVLWVALGAALAVYMTSTAVGKDHWPAIAWAVGIYIIVGAAYIVVADSAKPRTAGKGYSSTSHEAGNPGNDKSVEPTRIRYRVGQLSAATRSVVVLAILGAFFDVALTQGHFATTQSVLTLFLGGLFPAAILTGLSYSIPAADDAVSPLEPEVQHERSGDDHDSRSSTGASSGDDRPVGRMVPTSQTVGAGRPRRIA